MTNPLEEISVVWHENLVNPDLNAAVIASAAKIQTNELNCHGAARLAMTGFPARKCRLSCQEAMIGMSAAPVHAPHGA